MKTQAWATTDVGLKRDHNEDSYLCSEALQLYAVADGMGGHLGGERASRMAVEILEREVEAKIAALEANPDGSDPGREPTQPGTAAAPRAPMETATTDPLEWDPNQVTEPVRTPPELLQTQAIPPAAQAMREATRKAATAIYNEAQSAPERSGMGTTLTATLFQDDQLNICHVGDSRAYLYRGGRVRQLTEDHSWIQEQIRAGLIEPEDAMVSRFRNIITRSVGFEPTVEPDLITLPIQAGDLFLLCSDGLSNYLDEKEIGEVLEARPPPEVGSTLVDLANERGGDDNITCILIRVAAD
jgi:protein phosphatase